MEPIIIENKRSISNSIRDIHFPTKNNIFVFDIHKTTLIDGSGKPDEHIKKFIIQLLKFKYNVMFLSFDGNDKRIFENNKTVNKISQYKKLPKVFIKKRRKDLVIAELYKNNFDLDDDKSKYKVILIDDNFKNIKDVKLIKQKQPMLKITAFYYTRNTNYAGHDSLDKLAKYFNIKLK